MCQNSKKAGDRLTGMNWAFWLGAAFSDVDLRVHNKIHNIGAKNQE